MSKSSSLGSNLNSYKMGLRDTLGSVQDDELEFRENEIPPFCTSRIIFQHIVTLPKYGHSALNIRPP